MSKPPQGTVPVVDGFQVIDLGSTNGIEANGRQVGRHDLVDGDDLLLGATHIRIRLS